MIKVRFLGTGTSQGIPMIGCTCPTCTSTDPHDQRMRTSALVTLDDHNILIDATPEFRLQCLRFQVSRIDAVLITHAHADHIFGLDDIRRFNQMQGGPIDIYAAPEHVAILRKVFGYAEQNQPIKNLDIPQVQFRTIEVGNGACLNLFGHEIVPLAMEHGGCRSLGYRLGARLAYCTDLSHMPDEAVEQLRGIEVLILGALRPREHCSHLSFEQAFRLAEQIGAPRVYFVHMSHDVRHAQEQPRMPEHVTLAYDGLEITID